MKSLLDIASRQRWGWAHNPRVSDYDRDPSRRSPPRGRCWRTFSLQVGLGKLSQSVDWPLSQVATVGGRLNDCENFKKDLSGGAVVLCACFPNRNIKTVLSCLETDYIIHRRYKVPSSIFHLRSPHPFVSALFYPILGEAAGC